MAMAMTRIYAMLTKQNVRVRTLCHSHINREHSVCVHQSCTENCNFDSFLHIYIQHARLLLAKIQQTVGGKREANATVLRNNRASNQHMIRECG